MDDRQLFNEVFENFSQHYKKLKRVGTLIYYDEICMFNIDGYNLCYNLLRLTNLLNEKGELK